jgi:hypothetical protein
MEYAWLEFISLAVVLSVVYATREEQDSPQCPACAHRDRAISEVARCHLGWEAETERWLPTYATRHHLLCQHCGYRWRQAA